MEDKDLPRVSTILDTVDWGIKKAPNFILKKYGAYGTSFHSLVHKKISGQKTRISPRFKQKYEVFKEYLSQYEILKTEEGVVGYDPNNPERRYRGTPDLIVKDKNGYTYLMDIKTGKFYTRHWYQQAAYKIAIEQTHEGIKIDKILLVTPKEDMVEERECPDRTKEFLGILGVYYDKNL